jgi:hypothetical protein
MDPLEYLKRNVFPGESGGDYNALFGYSNRPGGQFAGVNLTDMTLGDVLQFTDPRGPYAQWVKGQVGRVATPTGAFQAVGTTLRGAVDAMGLPLTQKYDPATQDAIGMWIYQNQGPGAWEAWGKGGGGGGTVTASSKGGRPVAGLLDMGQMPEEDQGGIVRLLTGENKPWASKMNDIGAVLLALSGSPAAQPLLNQIEKRKDRKAEAEKSNKTLAWLAQSGLPNADMFLGAAQAGAMSPAEAAKSAITLAQAQNDAANNPNVQSSQMLPDMSGTVITMRDGSLVVRLVSGETVEGQRAIDLVQQSQEKAAELQRSIYGARREGTLGADIELGGEAARAVEQGKMAPGIAEDYNKRAELVQSSIGNLNSAIQAIDEGAQSGIVYDMLPNVTVASAELQNARQRLGLDVIGSVTFGALSEGEMKLAMDTAVPSGLQPAELRVWLERKRDAQQKALIAMQEAAMHFAAGGTREEYLRKIGVGGGGGGEWQDVGGVKIRVKP